MRPLLLAIALVAAALVATPRRSGPDRPAAQVARAPQLATEAALYPGTPVTLDLAQSTQTLR